MIYKSSFINKRNKEYFIEINNNDNTVEYFTLGSTPFTINFDSNEVYKPVKYSTATLQICENKLFTDLFANTIKQITCKLLCENIVVWQGYVKPSVYSQPLSDAIDYFDIELVDGLTVLDNIRYNLKGFQSLATILQTAILATGLDYKYIRYDISSNKSLTGLNISSSNFYDESGEAMTYSEVITELCRFMKYSIMAIGDEIWLIDYDHLKFSGGNINYGSYRLNNGSYEIVTGVVPTIDLKKTLSDYNIYNTPNISLSGIYDKVSITSSMYEKEEVCDDLFDTDRMYTLTSATNNYTVIEQIKDEQTTNKYNVRLLQTGNQNIKIETANNPTINNFSVALFNVNKINEEKNTTNDSYVLGGVFGTNRRLLATIKEDDSMFELGSIVINLSVLLSDNLAVAPVELQEGLDLGGITLRMQVKVGDYYFNGATWQLNPTTDANKYFDLPFIIDRDIKSGTWLNNSDVKFSNSVIGQTGYSLPYLLAGGKTEIKIFQPYVQKNSDKIKYCFIKDLKISYIKNKLAIGGIGQYVSSVENEDVNYSIMIDENNYQNFDDIDLKITSYISGKGRAKSSVIESFTGNREGINRTDYSLNNTDRHENILLKSYLNQYSKNRIMIDMQVNDIFLPYNQIGRAHV